MSLADFLFGRPLATSEDRRQKIGPIQGISIFGLDALGSAAYGPEAALTLLIPIGTAAPHYMVPISGCIIVLLSILYLSYWQTIEAYPSGGGAYTVAKHNFGPSVALFAGTALMIDYVLVAAVGISAGVGALVSAWPRLHPYTLPLCLFILAILTLINLRGVRDTGAVFSIPTFLFIGCLLAALALGAVKTIVAGGHPQPVAPLPQEGMSAVGPVSLWLLIRAFSSGCTAMTGVEAVSNGVMAFREPRTESARKTLSIVVGILALTLAGIAYLCRAYGIEATQPGQANYQSVLSQLLGAVAGKGAFYYVAIASILLTLAFQANTAFAGFPRLCRSIAEDGFLPRAFANRGRRLVYSHGTYVLTFLTAAILIAFGGITDRLIPLFAVGAFLAFTFSQAGMVAHWRRERGPHSYHSMLLNGLGALATGVTTVVIILSKFEEGAWATLLVIPAILILMRAVHGHYKEVEREIFCASPLKIRKREPPLVVVPVEAWNTVTYQALKFALTLSREVTVVHVSEEERDRELMENWKRRVEQPITEAGLPAPALVVLQSPYRYVIMPIVEYVLDLSRKHPGRHIAVVVPNLVERRWYQNFLHNQRGKLLTALMLIKGNPRIAIVNVPWYLKD